MDHPLGYFLRVHKDVWEKLFKRLLVPTVNHSLEGKERRLAKQVRDQTQAQRRLKYKKNMRKIDESGLHPDMIRCYWLMRLALTSMSMYRKVNKFVHKTFPKSAPKMNKIAAIIRTPVKLNLAGRYTDGIFEFLDEDYLKTMKAEGETTLINVSTKTALNGVSFLDLYQGRSKATIYVRRLAYRLSDRCKLIFGSVRVIGTLSFAADQKIVNASIILQIERPGEPQYSSDDDYW